MTSLAQVAFVQNSAPIKCNMTGQGVRETRALSVSVTFTGPDVPTMQEAPVVSCLGPVIPDLCLPTMPCPEPSIRDGPATENRWLFAELEGEA